MVEVEEERRSEETLLGWIEALNRDEPIGLEAGVKAGRTSRKLLIGNRHLRLFMVDPWDGEKDGGRYWSQGYHHENHLDALEKTEFAWNRRHVLAMTLEEASEFLERDVLDFAILDAVHDEQAVYHHLVILAYLVGANGFIAVRHCRAGKAGGKQAVQDGVTAFVCEDFHEYDQVGTLGKITWS